MVGNSGILDNGKKHKRQTLNEKLLNGMVLYIDLKASYNFRHNILSFFDARWNFLITTSETN